MNQEQQQALLANFAAWSGGFHPSECTNSQINTYVEMAMPTDLGVPDAEVISFLKGVAK